MHAQVHGEEGDGQDGDGEHDVADADQDAVLQGDPGALLESRDLRKCVQQDAGQQEQGDPDGELKELPGRIQDIEDQVQLVGQEQGQRAAGNPYDRRLLKVLPE